MNDKQLNAEVNRLFDKLVADEKAGRPREAIHVRVGTQADRSKIATRLAKKIDEETSAVVYHVKEDVVKKQPIFASSPGGDLY